MELTIISKSGEHTERKAILSDDIFGITPSDHAIYLDVKQYLANQRQGTHKSKERAEIAGSTRKLKKQKGTGGARAGSIKSPVFVGGGRVFGPRPRDYSFKLNKKVKQLARKSALTYKANTSDIIIIEDFNFEVPNTKDYIAFLQKIENDSKKTLLVLPERDKVMYLSSRNLQKAEVLPFNELNTYAILNADRLLIMESSVAKIETLFNN